MYLRTDYRKLMTSITESSLSSKDKPYTQIDARVPSKQVFIDDYDGELPLYVDIRDVKRVLKAFRLEGTSYMNSYSIKFKAAKIIEYPKGFDASKEFNESASPKGVLADIVGYFEDLAPYNEAVVNAFEDMKDNLIGCIELGRLIDPTLDGSARIYAHGGTVPGKYVLRVYQVSVRLSEISLQYACAAENVDHAVSKTWRTIFENEPLYKFVRQDATHITYMMVPVSRMYLTSHNVELNVLASNPKSGKEKAKRNEGHNQTVDELEK